MFLTGTRLSFFPSQSYQDSKFSPLCVPTVNTCGPVHSLHLTYPWEVTLSEAWCWVCYLFQPTFSESSSSESPVWIQVHHDLGLYYIFNLNFRCSCSYTQWANQTENSWSFLQCSHFFPPLFLFPSSEEDIPSTLQMKLLHTLRSDSSVTYYKSFPDFSHSQQEITVFLNFEVDYFCHFLFCMIIFIYLHIIWSAATVFNISH